MTISPSSTLRIGMREEIHGLLIGNAVVLVIALWQGWSVGLLMWPFWMQSVVIGLLNTHRMLSLRHFTTEGLTANGRPVPETDAGKRSTAWFFLMHYGIFHAVYLVFLIGREDVAASDWPWLLLGGATFAIGQMLDQPKVLARDARGRPNLGAMMFMPYLRVIPMHLAIGIGAGTAAGSTAILPLVLFTALKTAADVGMAFAERAIERKSLAKSTTSLE